MNNGFIIADIEGMVMVLNRAGAAILGFEEGEAPGRSVQSVLTPASSEESPVLAALRTQRDFTRYEFEVRTANGEERLIGLTTSGMYNPSGRMTGVIANFTDLTELSAMREELQRQDRLAAVGEMAGGLAHEIRNPVAAVRGAIEELRGGPDSAIAERLAAIALRECDNLNDIITDFLEFARNPEVQREPLDVCELVRAETAALAETANGDVRVELGDCPERVVVSADENQMRQVLHNIGKNALEAMSDTGGVLRLSVSADNVSAAILMEDQGPGIPPDHLAHIFEPFYTTKDAGVGMGLAIAMRIVTAHDGAIHAASRKEGGAAFTVRLPLVRAKEIPGV
jgi:PAS domain S-box-containing protein